MAIRRSLLPGTGVTHPSQSNLNKQFETGVKKAEEIKKNGTKYLVNTPANSGITVGKPTTRPSSGSGGGGGTSSDNSAALYQAYLAQIEAEQRRLAEEQQRRANEAYDRNVNAMTDAFAQRSGVLKNNLDSTLKNLATDYSASRDSINTDAVRSAQEAYINNMLSKRNLAQNMAAQGLSGGASETTMAGLENNYGNARNAIAATQNENLGSLEDLYNKNKNSAQQAYNDQLAADELQKAQYMVQFENDRQNALAQAYESQLSQLAEMDPSFLSGLSGLVTSQAGYTPTEQGAVKNTVSSVNTTQGGAGGSSGSSRNFYLNRARELRSAGRSDAEIAQILAGEEGLANVSIQSILNQLR